MIDSTSKNNARFLYKLYFKNTDFHFFTNCFLSFDINDRYHVVLVDNLARQLREYCQNNCHKSQKHILYRILHENFSKP